MSSCLTDRLESLLHAFLTQQLLLCCFYAEPARGMLLNIMGRRLIGCSTAVTKASAESSTSCCLLQEHPAAQAHTKQSRGIFAACFAEWDPRHQGSALAGLLGGKGSNLTPQQSRQVQTALTLGGAVSRIGNDKSPKGSYWWNPSEPLAAWGLRTLGTKLHQNYKGMQPTQTVCCQHCLHQHWAKAIPWFQPACF